jgi:hypothetical protein
MGGVASFDFQPSFAASVIEAIVGLGAAVCLASFLLRAHRRPSYANTK